MHARFLLLALLMRATIGLSADDPAVSTAITLRAFFDMIDEPAAVAEGFARSTRVIRNEEEVPQMRLEIPPSIVAHWMEIAEVLQQGVAREQKVDVFPPGLRDALKENEALPLKRNLLLPALAQIRDFGAAKAQAGNAPELRSVSVPTAWLDSYWRARDAFSRKRSQDFVAATKDEVHIVRNERGTFFRGSGGNLIKVAFPGAEEEGPVYCAPFGKGGKWNLYQAINRPTTWLLAEEAARAMSAPVGEKKIAGHLASIHSEGENQFLLRMLEKIPHAWIGLNDRRLEAFRDRAGTWEWSTGEPVTYFKWGAIEPNNASTPNNGGDEDGVVMDSENRPGRYGRWTDFGDGSRNGYNHRYPYLVEWEVAADAPIEGAELLPGFFAQPLPGPEGGEGTFGMRIVYGGGPCDSLDMARDAYLSGNGRTVNAQVPVLNFRDGDGPVRGALFPHLQWLPEQKEKERDENVAFLCRGRIRVEEAGIYTFGVVHDDGFAMRLKGHRWRSATGLGVINVGDPETIEHWWIAGAGCTLATIELPAGDHDLEFFGFQRDGDAYFQLFSAKGNFTSLNDTSEWRLIGHKGGDEIGMPGITAPGWEVTVTPPGKLTRPSYDGAVRALERNGQRQEQPEQFIDYSDPDEGAEFRLAGTKPFPGGQPKEKENDFAFCARGTLEIPRRGTYWLGFQTARGGRLTLAKQHWKRLVLANGSKTVIDEDLVEGEANAENGCRVSAEVELEAGKYPIEFIGCFAAGAAAVEITAAPARGPDLYLRAGDARVMRDVSGLQLVK